MINKRVQNLWKTKKQTKCFINSKVRVCKACQYLMNLPWNHFLQLSFLYYAMGRINCILQHFICRHLCSLNFQLKSILVILIWNRPKNIDIYQMVNIKRQLQILEERWEKSLIIYSLSYFSCGATLQTPLWLLVILG